VSYFIKISALCYGINYLYMNVFRCVFIYRMIESLEYACLLVIVVHVIKSFLLCILIILKGIGKRKKSRGGLEGGVPRPVGGQGVLQIGIRARLKHRAGMGWVCWSESRG
jgi:hypothetical protein